MQLSYGDYVHDDAEVWLAIQRQPRTDASGQQSTYLERFDIGGELQATSQSELTTLIAALKTAYGRNGQDLILFENGGARSAHSLISGDSLGGTRVVAGPSFLEGRGGEYSTWRSYAISVEAEFESPLAAELVSYTETVDFTGNGSGMFTHVPVLRGQWVRQDTTTHSVFRASQRGEAVGRRAYPFAWVPPPIWPGGPEQGFQRRLSFTSPTFINGEYRDYRIAWEYTFESTVPLFGLPTRRRR